MVRFRILTLLLFAAMLASLLGHGHRGGVGWWAFF